MILSCDAQYALHRIVLDEVCDSHGASQFRRGHPVKADSVPRETFSFQISSDGVDDISHIALRAKVVFQSTPIPGSPNSPENNKGGLQSQRYSYESLSWRRKLADRIVLLNLNLHGSRLSLRKYMEQISYGEDDILLR